MVRPPGLPAMSILRRFSLTFLGPIRRSTRGAQRIPSRSMPEPTAVVRVEPTSSARARSPGSVASARYIRMPLKTPKTLAPTTRASSSSIPAPSSDIDLGNAADGDEAEGVEAERDDDGDLSDDRSRHAVEGAGEDRVHQEHRADADGGDGVGGGVDLGELGADLAPGLLAFLQGDGEVAQRGHDLAAGPVGQDQRGDQDDEFAGGQAFGEFPEGVVEGPAHSQLVCDDAE